MEGKKKTETSGKQTGKTDLVLKKHVGMIHCENRLTLLQRKICNIFLFNALEKIEKEEIHAISLRQLCSLIEYRSNDLDLIKKSIKTLISTVMEWNLLDDSKYLTEESCSKDSISWNASSLLAGATIERGVIRYSYSPQIRSVLSSLDIYGRINLFVQARFNSSYSLALYENCVRFLKIGRTSWMDLGLFRSLMGLVDGQYPLFKELKRNVITVAINEVNKKSDILVVPDFRRVGRQIAGIRFLVSENEGYQPKFRKVVTGQNTIIASGQTDITLSLVERLVADFGIQKGQAESLVVEHPEKYISEKIDIVKNKKAKNRAAYLVAAIKNDYRENVQSWDAEKNHKISEYQREPVKETETRSLKIKYTQYKFSCYMEYLDKVGTSNKVIDEFINHERKENRIMGNIYKKNGIKTIPAMVGFMSYVDREYPDHQVEPMGFDDYIVSEHDDISTVSAAHALVVS